MEKKSDVDWMKIVRDRSGFKESYIVPSDGSSGGLALFWNLEIKMQVLSSSLSYIDGIVNEGSTSNKWHMTGFYGNPDTSRRVESWKLLNSLSAISPLPWLVIVDFNEIKLASEKVLQGPNNKWLTSKVLLILVGLGRWSMLGQSSLGFIKEVMVIR